MQTLSCQLLTGAGGFLGEKDRGSGFPAHGRNILHSSVLCVCVHILLLHSRYYILAQGQVLHSVRDIFTQPSKFRMSRFRVPSTPHPQKTGTECGGRIQDVGKPFAECHLHTVIAVHDDQRDEALCHSRCTLFNRLPIYRCKRKVGRHGKTNAG